MGHHHHHHGNNSGSNSGNNSGDGNAHKHEHHHHHGSLHGKSLGLAIVLNSAMTIAQGVVGVSIGSLSLLSDAMHNFSDVLSLVISYIANRLIRRQCTPEQTFGYKRAEIIAAFINVLSLLVVAYLLVSEAIERLQAPVVIASQWVILLAFAGIVVNGGSVLLLRGGAEDNSNIKSAYLHLVTDMLTSLAVMIGGCLMLWYEVYWLDNVLTILIAIYLVYSSWGLLMQTLRVLMQFTPAHIDLSAIKSAVESLPSVANIHHVHIWQINDTEVHFEAHVDFKEDLPLSAACLVLASVSNLLQEKFGIHHTLLQPEIGVDDPKHLIADERASAHPSC